MTKLVVMGVAGSGKSALAARLAEALSCPLIEGDDFHPKESQDKMRNGIALDDADREPWLARLGELMASRPGSQVLTCSALKRRYRERLRLFVPELLFVYIVYQCYSRKGEKAAANPWDGAEGLEWTLPSPPPYHTFETPPEVK